MKNITKKIILPLFLIMALISCDHLLEEEPYSIIAPQTFFKTESDFNSAVIGAYTILLTGGLFGQHYTNTIVAFTWETNIPRTSVDYTLAFDPTYINAQRFWTSFYSLINQCNMIIMKLDEVNISEHAKNVLKGEAHFLRGMAYFELNRLYGGVPLHLEPTESLDNVLKPRSSIQDVYLQIITDLSIAENLLPLVNTFEKGRAAKGAAAGLLAKVYLTMAGNPLNDLSKLQLAREKLLEIVDPIDPKQSKSPYLFQLENNFQSLFLESVQRLPAIVSKYANENGPESVFEINFKGLEDGTPSCVYPHASSFNGRAGNLWIYNIFDANDYRREVTFCKAGDPYGNVRVQRKFPRTGSLWNNHENNWHYLRYADLILMLAEVENELNGPTDLAHRAINAIRTRARNANGTPRTVPADYSDISSKEQMRDLIYKERQLELAVEGQTWFDWLRTGRIRQMVEMQNSPNRVYRESCELLPIPMLEITLSKGVLEQNPGY